MAETFNFDVKQGTAPKLRFYLTRPENVAGWTTRFVIMDIRTNASIVNKVGGIADLTEEPTALTNGIFDTFLTAVETAALPRKTYRWTFERTNAGAEDLLGEGELTVKIGCYS